MLGLGFGDCGKGLFTDYLCRSERAHTVVRFNGGAQAGHNVVLADGRHHTFSQIGAGAFVADVVTVLASPVIVHPTALLVEQSYLTRVGVHDALQRLLIDARCRVTTPFHQAAGRLRELQRGGAAHGSCGVGVGETVRHALACPQQQLQYGDLRQPVSALARLEAQRLGFLQEFVLTEAVGGAAWDAELVVLKDASIARRWLGKVAELLDAVKPADHAQIGTRLRRPGCLIFEGAQGVLLDEWHGFYPHTTWSSINTGAVEAVLADAGSDAVVQHFGVLRAYLTRHGQGPMPTEDRALDCVAEPHNAAGGWQGNFRRGQPDAVLLRYALAVAGRLDGLLVSHLDVFDKLPGLRWCSAYRLPSETENDSAGTISTLEPNYEKNLQHQMRLTALLRQARPMYEPELIGSATAMIAAVEQTAVLPVMCGAFGPTAMAVQQLRALASH